MGASCHKTSDVARTAKSCGPDAPTLASSLVEFSARRRWQKSPVTGESTKETVKPLRRECRLKPVNLWKTTAFCAATGAPDTRHSLGPCVPTICQNVRTGG